MSDHEDVIYLGHMLDMSHKALRLIEGKQRHDYDCDESLRLALAYLLQVIGEAARRVSKEFFESHPDIPWKAIIGMRHKVVHDYMDVDEDIVWDTVTTELQPLIDQLKRVVPTD